MSSRLVAAVLVGVFTVAGLASYASAFAEPIPTKISLLKWGGNPKVGKLYKIVSKPPTSTLFTLPTGDPVTLGGSVQVKVGNGVLNCTLAPGAFAGSQGWKGLGNPAGSKGYKYINKEAGKVPGADPCKTVIIKEKVIKVLSKSVGSIALPVDYPPGNPEVAMFLTVGTDEYCALAVPPHSKEKAGALIKMKTQAAPANCLKCGDNSINRVEEECDGTDDSACPGRCVPPGGGGGTCGDDVKNGGDECTCATEQCDGADAAECEGLCLPNCTCPEPVCNNGVKEVGELCDPAGSTEDCGSGEVCGGFCECVTDQACDCGDPEPTMYMYRNAPPDSVGQICGTTDGSLTPNLDCMGLYIGGGGGALPVPNMVPDQATTKFNIDQCVGTDITLATTSPAQVGKRHCSEGKRCQGGTNNGQPCIRDRHCPGGTCQPQCWYGSYLTILNTALPGISTCISNEIVEDCSGGLDCASGKAFSRIPLDSVVHLTLIDQSPSTPGHNACPICVGGTLDVPNSGVCEGGPNKTKPCMPMSTPYDTWKCCNTKAIGYNSVDCNDDSDCGGRKCSVTTGQSCVDDSDCPPGETCPAVCVDCSMYPTSLDCPPAPLASLGPGLLLTLQMNTEGPQAYKNTVEADANGYFCGWCRDIVGEGSQCFEGDPDPDGTDPDHLGDHGCPDSSIIACRPSTYGSSWPAGDPADLAECGDATPCRTDADCTAPYETCMQRNPGAWRDAAIKKIVYDQASRPGDLRDKTAKPSTIVTNFCIPPNFDWSIDNDSDLGGPGGLSLNGTAKLSPSGAFIDVTTGLLD